jgi:hypothetical protein
MGGRACSASASASASTSRQRVRTRSAWLLEVTADLLGNHDSERRARAVRLLGWLDGTEARLGEIARADESLWVRGLAEQSVEQRRREGFARHWLGRFLDETLPREVRWSAGQLFLEAADRCLEAWGFRFMLEKAQSVRARGEALLLLDDARREVEGRDLDALKKRFLGTDVSDLENSCGPWRQPRDWAEVTRRYSGKQSG